MSWYNRISLPSSAPKTKRKLLFRISLGALIIALGVSTGWVYRGGSVFSDTKAVAAPLFINGNAPALQNGCTCRIWAACPCSGTSEWGSFISCQYPRCGQPYPGCQGCCFAYNCPPPTPVPTPIPPDIVTITSSNVVCGATGGAGWCRGSATLNAAASDSLGHSISFSGDVSGGNPLSYSLPEGQGTISFTAHAPAADQRAVLSHGNSTSPRRFSSRSSPAERPGQTDGISPAR